MQFLIENGIISIEEPEEIVDTECSIGTVYDPLIDECIIPDDSATNEVFLETLSTHQSIVTSWIKVTALWWGQGKIADQDFVEALNYLIENKILEIPKPEPEVIIEKKSSLEIILEKYPTYTSSWTPISTLNGFRVQGHNVADSYFLRFTLISVDGREISSDGSISISIFDEYNRILYLDSFSVRKNDFSKLTDSFTGTKSLVYSWDIPTIQIKKGFGDYGMAKIVFTDRGGNSFSDEFSKVSIPKFN